MTTLAEALDAQRTFLALLKRGGYPSWLRGIGVDETKGDHRIVVFVPSLQDSGVQAFFSNITMRFQGIQIVPKVRADFLWPGEAFKHVQ